MKRFISLLCCLMLALGCAAAEQVTPMPTLSSGALDLLAVDHRLYELGYRDGACTGKLDDVLINALENFQRANGLEISGEPDSRTVSLLMSGNGIPQKDYISELAFAQSRENLLENGAHGENVVRLQKALKALGYFTDACDGAYGRATEEAVYRFQLSNGLKMTGIADRSVTLRLYSEDCKTWGDFLEESCASAGASGMHVRRIQIWLAHKGYFNGAATGRYGEGTQQAVRRFQAANGMESSGDVDLETCIVLFSDVNGMQEEISALRRGDTGEAAEALMRSLMELGYPANGQFDVQTELALMQFQQVNEIPVTGVADSVTLSWLSHPNVLSRDRFAPGLFDVNTDGDERTQLVRQASALMGSTTDFESEFGFVSYVSLRCGLPLLNEDQLHMEKLEDRSSIYAGQLLRLQLEDREFWGVATADGAVICRNRDGCIVMRYLDMMKPVQIYGSFNTVMEVFA